MGAHDEPSSAQPFLPVPTSPGPPRTPGTSHTPNTPGASVWRYPPSGEHGYGPHLPQPSQPSQAPRPSLPDSAEPAGGDVAEFSAFGERDVLALRFPGAVPEVLTPEWLRLQARQLLREFLSAVPRSEHAATVTFLRPDGRTSLLTRAQLSTAIDLLRPRQRQGVRLALEERWSHKRVCAYLNDVSLRTLERDLTEALDALAQL